MSVKKIRLFLLFSFLFFHFSFAWAFDFGMFLNQNTGYSGADSGGGDSRSNFDYSIGAVPWLSGLLGQTGDFIVTAGFEADYNKGWEFVPELLRTGLAFRPGNWAFEIGRMYHSDPLGFVAAGLFDGFKASYYSEAGTFSAGAWYTGLLYKKRTVIEMTVEEFLTKNAPLDYGDFADTYFAPKRFLSALGWEHLGGAVQAKVSVLGQFELFADEPLNSQYAVFKLTLPVNAFSFNLGGCLELIENEGKTKGEIAVAFAAEAAVACTFPASIMSRLSLLGRYSSSGGGEQTVAFLPLTTENQGNVLGAKLSGLSMVSLDYLIRLHPAFSAGLTSSYFIRSDLETYNGYPLPGDKDSGYFLGNEFFARLLWSPASDLQINLGAGVFMPSLGNAAPKADNSWRAELKVVFSL
jgi:hypothetical protein